MTPFFKLLPHLLFLAIDHSHASSCLLFDPLPMLMGAYLCLPQLPL